MIRYVALLAMLSVAASSAHRSQGYVGSTPVGLNGYVASASFDCTRINADPRRSLERVPISEDCVVTIPSPDRRIPLRAEPMRNGVVALKSAGKLVVAGLEQPTVLLWNPDSSGFVVNDSEGSGQVSRLRYFRRTARGWVESRSLNQTASALYRKRYDCRAGAKSYTNVSGWDWRGSGRLRAIVQEGVHSEGCLQPHENRNVLFEVIGEPVTGRIFSAREVAMLR